MLDMTLDDFLKYCGSSIILFRYKKDPQLEPVYVYSRGELRDGTGLNDEVYYKGLVILKHSRLGNIIVDINSHDIEWDLGTPSKKLVNYRNRVITFMRYSARQWSRGLCNKTGSISWLTKSWSDAYHILNGLRLDNLELAYNLHYPEYPIWEQVSSKLKNFDMVEAALSPRFAVTQGIYSTPELFIWYNNTIIGTMTHNDQITVTHSGLVQELDDFIRRFRLPWKIIG